MSALELVERVIGALERLGVPYMVVGSFSSNVYGQARSTKDADFVVEMGATSAGAIAREAGADFVLDPQMSFETITATTRYRLLHPGTAFLIELFLLSDDPHDQERFGRRVSGQIGQTRVHVPTAEDVVVTKLRWSKGGQRVKDLEDVRHVLAVQAGRLDLGYVRQWCGRHGTLDVLEKLLGETH